MHKSPIVNVYRWAITHICLLMHFFCPFDWQSKKITVLYCISILRMFTQPRCLQETHDCIFSNQWKLQIETRLTRHFPSLLQIQIPVRSLHLSISSPMKMTMIIFQQNLQDIFLKITTKQNNENIKQVLMFL